MRSGALRLLVALQAAGLGLAEGQACSVGEDVPCPYSGVKCGGRQCCPGGPETGNRNFVCPSAPPEWNAVSLCQIPHKVTDCVAAPTQPPPTAPPPAPTTTATRPRLRSTSRTATSTVVASTTSSQASTSSASEPTSTTTTTTTPATAAGSTTATATGTTRVAETTTSSTATATDTATATSSAMATSTDTATTTGALTATTTAVSSATTTAIGSATATGTVTTTTTTTSSTAAMASEMPTSKAASTTTTTTTAPSATTAGAATSTPAGNPLITTTSFTTTVTTSLCEAPVYKYSLQWSAVGHSFFDDWEFLTSDYNHGAALYLPKDEAVSAGVAEANADHAILRTGARAGTPAWPKRESAKIQTRQGWKYFLMMMKYSHVPWGCGVWPALWTHAAGVPWPNGGELDILEYANDGAQQTSFHTGEANSCKLDPQVVSSCGKPMPDTNGMGYDCDTKYPDKLGCAPNTLPILPGELWSRDGGMVAVQWTESFLKVFHIPTAELPGDADGDEPKPHQWDEWLVSYYPFAASEARTPGSCPRPGDVMAPQHLVLNINMCGDWAGKVWNTSGTCVNVHGPAYPSQCRAVDPLKEYDPENDCCTQFIYDGNGTYGADAYLQEQAYFNISWVKLFQAHH